MSSQSTTSEQSSKKRKHDGDPQESRKKKRKNEGATDASDDTDAVKAAKIAKKEKRKRDRAIEESENGISTEPSRPEIAESDPTSEKKKKKKKSQEETEPQSVHEDTTMLVNSRTGTEINEDSIVENGYSETVEEIIADADENATVSEQLQSSAISSFQAVRMSLYLPVPAVASSKILSALLTVHISPLLLTFFPPAGGVVLSYHDPLLSATPQPGAGKPSLPPDQVSASSSEVYSIVGEEFGTSWIWLTITLLVFKPEAGSELTGFTNAMSEGFVGLVSYNYFQTSIPRSRIPKNWSWNGPSRQKPKHQMMARKGVLNDSDGPSQDTLVDSQDQVREDDAADGIAGSFLDADGNQVSEDLNFRVVDLEMIQAQERGRQFALQLEGTLLDEESEQQIRDEERLKWEARKNKHKTRSRTPGTPMMSGGLPTHSRAGSVISAA